MMKVAIEYHGDDESFQSWIARAQEVKKTPEMIKYIMLPLSI
jgi:hypothetical protein